MFEDLSRKLDGVLGRFRQRGLLTEPMIRDGLREVRRALLEADVNFRVTREFLNRVSEKAMGERVLKSVSPGQQIVKIVHDELAHLIGGEGQTELTWSPAPPTVIMLVGLQGSGKTSTAAKLAKRLARQGKRPLLAACDLYRPAAVDQLRVLGKRAGVPVHHEEGATDPVEVARASHRAARSTKADALIVDTAGRLQIDEPLMDELARIRKALDPREILLVADAMTGQEAVRIAEGFDRKLGVTGFVLAKMDGDARGGAALSIHGVTGKPMKFVGTGEGLDALEAVDPRRIAGRILQKGDVVGLVERAQAVVDAGQAAAMQEKVLGRGRFTLEDFLVAMRQVQKMGPLDQLLKMVPGMPRGLSADDVDPKRMKHIEAIILSMTPEERRRPEILNGSRRKRIARGSGRPVAEVNRLMKRFAEMEKMMKRMKGLMPSGVMPSLTP
ncbi:MAG: signal recognition particle protein [Gemmatimonadetes bacterium]|nr:signal recognition particle protein [Gemmatimonadota bacterium]MYC93081.1 signal recognition particle protein [Gemmatimonadota bacterium]MYG36627.1 signal recognition particle protein [Gemmatimonadota bacterium]